MFVSLFSLVDCMEQEHLHLFEGFGIELEYIIANKQTLSVSPLADELLCTASGEDRVSEVQTRDITWSNSRGLHGITTKTNGLSPLLVPLPTAFAEQAKHINALLADMDACLMPGAMHPWMNPRTEMKLWPHDGGVYEAFHNIFDCGTHGWANLQSMQISLPFYDDREFARLHAAIRLVLPIIPALAASSPVVNGAPNGIMDNRLEAYRSSAARIPSISGRVIPEQVWTRKDYERDILQRLYDDIAPYDPNAMLQTEELNARGAIARFGRGTIEIRVIDAQECPLANISIAAAVIAVVEALTGEFSASLILQQAWETDPLYTLLIETTKDAESTVISNAKYLRMMRYPEGNRCRASELWQHLIETVLPASLVYNEQWETPINTMLAQGTLARRISRAIGKQPDRDRIAEVYGQLCSCLAEGTMFKG